MTTWKTVAQLAELVGGQLVRGDPAARVCRVLPTNAAAPDSVTFVTKPEYFQSLATTPAAAVLVSPEVLARSDVTVAPTAAVITVKHPYAAFARVAQVFADRVPAPLGVHPSAVIEAGAELAPHVAVGPFVYVAAGAKVGEGAVLHAGVHVNAGARVGAGTILYDHVVIRHHCSVGAQCILHPGVVIGSDGFGFALAENGDVEHVKIPQVGHVEVGDDVEIGANSCVDRGALGVTRIGSGTKIDNLVQVGHNVEIGPGSVLVAQSGVAGSSRLGRRVILGAQSGISGHLTVGDGAMVLGQAGIMHDVEPGVQMMGSPAVKKGDFFRTVVRTAKLDALFARVKKLERGRAEQDRSEGGASVPSEARDAVVLERGRSVQDRSEGGASVPSEARDAVVLERRAAGKGEK